MRRQEASHEELTGYLDGSLETEPRGLLEERLANEPALAEELRGLMAVRDLVAGLSRPSLDVDLSARVMNRMMADRAARSRRMLSPEMWRASLQAIRVASAAAALLAVASLPVVAPLLLSRVNRAPNLASVAPRGVASRPSPPPGEVKLAGSDDKAERIESVRPSEPRLIETPPPAPVMVVALPENDKFRRLLDSPGMDRRIVVADLHEGDPTQRVEWILHDSPRRYANFVRISLDPAENPDPEHPGSATVYAVVLDEREAHRLFADLSLAFPLGLVEDQVPRPEIVARLAGVGRVEVLEGTAVADLIEVPGETLASRVIDDGHLMLNPRQAPFHLPSEIMNLLDDPDRDESVVPAEPSGSPLGSGEQTATGMDRAAKESVEPRSTKDAPTPPRSSRSVVLVWVPRAGTSFETSR